MVKTEKIDIKLNGKVYHLYGEGNVVVTKIFDDTPRVQFGCASRSRIVTEVTVKF